MNTVGDPESPKRRSLRLPAYDYAQAGAYFVTACAYDRRCLFGDIVDGAMRLNDVGRVVETCWDAIPDHFPHAGLDAYVVMPNHIHGIVWITAAALTVGAKNLSPLPGGSRQQKSPSPSASSFQTPSRTLGSIVRGFKTGVTKRVRKNMDVHHVWQRNYYDHVIRNEADLQRIRQYVANNPARWAEDRENPLRALRERKSDRGAGYAREGAKDFPPER